MGCDTTGSRYDSKLTTKEIAAKIRAYVKEKYPDYRFSVRIGGGVMGSSIHIDMKRSPIPIYKTADELDTHDVSKIAQNMYDYDMIPTIYGAIFDEVRELCRKIYAQGYATREGYSSHLDLSNFSVLNDTTQEVVNDVNAYVQSYNYDDSDPYTDYFSVNFYDGRCEVRDVEIVPPKAKRMLAVSTDAGTEAAEYDISEDVHTKTGEKLWIVKILKSLSRDEYISEKQHMSELGGYYSKFKHGFVFKADPTGSLV